MGKKSTRPFKGKKKQEKENFILTKSGDSYSDDYRLTPDFLLQEVPPYCNGANCCSRRRVCPQGEICCSRETCFPPERRHRRNPSSVSPCRRHVCEDAIYEDQTRQDVRKLKKADMEMIVVNDRRLNVRKSPSFCSSCDSCDSCASGDSSYTRVELTNNLFTSPLESTQASFYNVDLDPHLSSSPNRYPGQRSRRSPMRRGGSCAGDLGYVPDEGFLRRKANLEGLRNRKGTRRAKSFNEVSSHLEEQSRSPAEVQKRDKTRIASSGNRNKLSEEDSFKQRNKNKNGRHCREPSHPSRSPTRSNVRASDSGVGKNCQTSGSSGIGGSRSHSSRSGERRGRTREDRGSRKERKDEEKDEASNLKQVNLLNRMVNQTREHRKQIKTLESELERLRTSGDALTTCEVNQRDVEWRPGDIVGEGSFSTVYKGTYCGTEVAVKELKCKLSQDDKNYFRSEAALLQQLHHPRIVLLMGVCTSSARPFMLLEYLPGGTLHSLIHTTTRERLDHAAYFSIAKDVAQGLNYLHKHDPQVLHLDLKSMNVLLDSYTRAKIADFGFSILRRSRGGGGSAVQRGSIRGTPAWMAPELLTRGDVSPKCDVYSYAIILWEMLTASHPFQGLDIFHIMEAVEDGGRPPLPKTGVSRELRELITSCWAQNPSLRPSFEEILGALETASLPSSWRKVLTKANITPSTLTDVTAARAIIGMIERSAELLENTHLKHRKRSKSDEIENEINENEKVRQRISRKNAIYDSSAVTSAHKGRAGSPKGKKYRPVSSSRDSPFESNNRAAKSSNLERRERRSPTKGLASPRREKRSVERRVFSPNRKDFMDNEGAKHLNAKRRRSKERRSKTRSPQRNDRRDRHERSYSRSPSKGRYSRREERGREYKGKSDKKYCASSRSQRLEEEFTAEESHFTDERSGPKDSRRSSNGSSDEERDLRRRQMESGNTSDELESHVSSRKSYRKSSERSSPRRKSPVASPTRSPRTRSPQRRRSPTRRSYSPEKVESDYKRQESGHPQKYGGIVLTAEQLLNQKQRLRPVRPSALKDLSLLPQSSLNDISLILKQAMIQRRDALEQIQSIRRTVQSKDNDWSDWS